MAEYILSVGTGDWNSAGTWTDGVIPGSTGHEGSLGQIEVGHTVTVTADPVCGGFVINGGSLDLHEDFTITDTPGSGLWITSTNSGGITSNGTASAPVLVRYAGANGDGNVPGMLVSQVSSVSDARVLDLAHIQFVNCSSFLGGTTNHLHFDYIGATSPHLTSVTPLTRDQRIVSHFIPGRGHGRVYPAGGSPGTLQISGVVHWSTGDWNVLTDMENDQKRICFISPQISLTKCYIERLSFNPRTGSMWLPFTATLIEEGWD